MKTILITSVGSLVGQSILDSLENRRQNLRIVGTNSDASAWGNFRCETAYLVRPAVDRTAFAKDLSSVIEREAPDVIIPGRDDDIELLGRLRDRLYPDSGAFLCGHSDFAAVMADKVRSWHFARDKALPFAPTVETGLPDSLRDALSLGNQYGFPLIAKPRYGNGTRGVRLVVNADQLQRIAGLRDYAIQPFIGDKPECELDTSCGLPFFWEVPEQALFGAQILIGRDASVLDTCLFQLIMVMGRCEGMTLIKDPRLLAVAHQYADAAIQAGWIGILNVQMKKRSDQTYTAIEMNGRFSGSTSGRRFFGFDEVRIMLNAWLGESFIPPHPGSISRSIVRQFIDIPVPDSDISTLKAHGVWQKSGA
jgi:carbamoyl-phosphate synthase large subunit